MNPLFATRWRSKALKRLELTERDDKILFWDKNVGKTIPVALQLLNPPDVTIKYYLEEYRGTDNLPEMGDDTWLVEAGERNWFVISQDYNLHRRNNGLFALKQHNVGCFTSGAQTTRNGRLSDVSAWRMTVSLRQ